MKNKQIVSAVISMSLDGYIAGERVSPEFPLGIGGSMLHEWMTDGSPETDEVFGEGGANLGVVICGRLTYDLSIPWWKEDGPTGPARLPVFVISDNESDTLIKNGVYTFVKDIDTAYEMAKAASFGKDISVMGGAKTIQRFLNKKYIDEIHIQLIPIILGGGKRLFDNIDEQLLLSPLKTISSENAIHLSFSVDYPME